MTNKYKILFIVLGLFFYNSSFAQSSCEEDIGKLLQSSSLSTLSTRAIEIVSLLKNGDREQRSVLIEELSQNRELSDVIYATNNMGGEKGVVIEVVKEIMSREGLSDYALEQVAESAGMIRGEKGYEILKEVLNRERLSEDVLFKIVESAGKIGGEKGYEILKEVLSWGLPEDVLSFVAFSTKYLEGERRGEILREIMSRENLSDKVLSRVALATEYVGGEKRDEIVDKILNREGLSENVLNAIAESAEEAELRQRQIENSNS